MYKKLIKAIKEERQAKRLTQKECGEFINVKTKAYAKREYGKIILTYNEALTLITALELDPKKVLTKSAINKMFGNKGNTLCDVLKNARLMKNMTLSEVAKIMEVDRSTYGYKEKGKSQIVYEDLAQLVNIFSPYLNYVVFSKIDMISYYFRLMDYGIKKDKVKKARKKCGLRLDDVAKAIYLSKTTYVYTELSYRRIDYRRFIRLCELLSPYLNAEYNSICNDKIGNNLEYYKLDN